MKKEKVVVGLSGGVDSSVAAYLLKEQGYDVVGITIQFLREEEKKAVDKKGGCCGLSVIDDARRVAHMLDIPFYVVHYEDTFQEKVIDYFVDEYYKGKTPNPCIVCNRKIKWTSLLEHALQIGAQYIATGHYASIVKLDNGRYSLKKSVTALKDQTYALYNLTQKQLSHTLMPVGAYTKDEIRKIAEQIHIEIANKPDSQDICFIPDKDYAKFLKDITGEESQSGNFIDLEGNILGQHKGIIHYTVGQRKGLGLSLGRPVFVIEIRPGTNEVVLGSNEDVYGDTLYADTLNFMPFKELENPIRVTGKIRYAHQAAPCTIQMVNEQVLKCTFDTPQRAITPGQAVVFYDQDLLVGGGTIIRNR